MSLTSSIAGIRVETSSRIASRSVRGYGAIRCQAYGQESSSRRQLLGAGLMLAATIMAPAAKADLIEDLKAKSEANKELNDKKRLATSYANVERSRSVSSGTCKFPSNFFGCDNEAVAGKVKYITDDIDLACQGAKSGYCPEKVDMTKLR